MKRIICFLLTLIMLASVLASCAVSNGDSESEGTSEPPSDSQSTVDSENGDKNGENDSNNDAANGNDDANGENNKDDVKEPEMPKVDIQNCNAKQKYFVGTTNKNAVSYTVFENMEFTVKLQADGKLASCPYFKYSLSADDGTSTPAQYADGSTGTLTVKTKISRAGFVYLKVEACDENKNPISGVDKFEGGAGADIANITKNTNEPADFDEFWAAQVARLSTCEPELIYCEQVEKGDTSDANFNYYYVKIKFLDDATYGNYVSGYLCVPKNATADSLTSMGLEFMGAGVSDISKLSRANGAKLVVAAHSMELGKDASYYRELSSEGGRLYQYGFNSTWNSDRDTVYFKKMILRDIQAVRFMKKYFADNAPSFTGTSENGGASVNFAGLLSPNAQIDLSGGSQGGFQCLAVSALEEGISYQVAYCPWLCDIGGYGVNGTQKSNYMPEYTSALEYYDAINFAVRAKCTTLIRTVGLGDTTATPRGNTALYNAMATGNRNNVRVEITYWQNRTHSYTAPTGTYDAIVLKNY